MASSIVWSSFATLYSTRFARRSMSPHRQRLASFEVDSSRGDRGRIAVVRHAGRVRGRARHAAAHRSFRRNDPRSTSLAEPWSRKEVEATVDEYFEMLSAEVRAEPYSKAQHRRRLLPLLRGRSEGAVERKTGNISAVLIELGHPYIDGYKPFVNYQQLLFDVVAERLEGSRELAALVAADVDAPVSIPSVDDILAALVDVPLPAATSDRVRDASPGAYRATSKRPPVDYLRRESENRSLGGAGELFALNFERARLIAAGEERLAARIEHVSNTRGDGDGFDILSYETSGRERLIEVKTTKYGSRTPFFVTANEVRVSEREAHRFQLYRVFSFRKSPRLFAVPGAVSSCFSLNPAQFVARIA